MSAGGGGGFRAGLRTVRAVGFLIPLFPPDFDEAGAVGPASACGEDAAVHSARRLTSAIGPPTADTQIDLHLL
jgi:hypothetical protein